MKQKVGLSFEGKKISLEVKRVGFFGKIIGLMFSRRDSDALLFNFSRPTRIAIHSIFVFNPFLAVWTDEDFNVVDYKLVRPFCLSVKPKNNFVNLIEIPFSKKYSFVLKEFGFSRR